jgi:hypothetical protein
MLGVLFLTTSLNALSVMAILCLIYIFTKYDPLTFIAYFPTKLHFAPVLLAWWMIHYILLVKTGLKEQALKKYSGKTIPYGGICVLLAIIANVLFVVITGYYYMKIKFPK